MSGFLFGFGDSSGGTGLWGSEGDGQVFDDYGGVLEGFVVVGCVFAGHVGYLIRGASGVRGRGGA